jgi:OmpA-OmpF porin, OOP family
MIVRMLRVVMAGVLLLLANGALAQQAVPNPWYVSVGAGAAWYLDQKVTGAPSGKISTDTGYTGNVSIGRYIDDIRVVRLELETLYSDADANNFGGAKISGDIANLGVMLNLLYDIHTDSSWIPYIGGGIGYGHVDMNNITQNGVVAIDGTDDTFAYQFKAGIAYQFNPSMAVTAGYRFYATNNLSFGGQPGGTVKTEGVKLQGAELGFRFHF